MLPLFFGLPPSVSYIVLAVLGILIFLVLGKTILGWVMIGEHENGAITKKWGLGNSSRLAGGRIIASNGEAGIQAKMLEPGLHFGYWWWMYSITKIPITRVGQGQIAIIEAIDGGSLPAGSIMATSVVDCNSFMDGAMFLQNGGQKGFQRNYLANGEYRINTFLFNVEVVDATEIAPDQIGYVTTQDGKSLPAKMIAGPKIAGHESYQNADHFLTQGGFRGLQEEVLLPGLYYLNTRFADVERAQMTRVEVGNVGVVNSFIGDEGVDQSSDSFTHGKIVKQGQKGIWEDTLDPGLHAINTRLQDVIIVPTTNIVLNWKSGAHEDHQLDKDLETIRVRSKDGFTFPVEVSQVINISAKAAPRVIARFGTVENLVAQVLEPTISNYFRNSAQTSDALEFVSKRSERQASAKEHIKGVLAKYDVECVDTLIGDIDPPAALMKILSDRKVAEEQREMFAMQVASEQKRQEFVKAETAATKEQELTAAKYDKDIETQRAETAAEKAKGLRDAAKIDAEGKAFVFETVGQAEAKNIDAVGSAQAGVIKKKTEAMGTQQFALVQIFEALATSKTPLVPQILVQGGGEGGGNGSLLEALIGNEMLKDLRTNSKELESSTVKATQSGMTAPTTSVTDNPPAPAAGGDTVADGGDDNDKG